MRALGLLLSLILMVMVPPVSAQLELKIGVPSVYSGDLAAMGDNIQKTIETYRRRYLRHPLTFIFEDAGKSGLGGLNAYKKLIEIDRVAVIIGGTVSNGTLAGAPLINHSKTVTITPLTGGSNIDDAGEYLFRLGNSDILNGKEQAALFKREHLLRVALLTEETDYTQDIASHFRADFLRNAGDLVFDETFLPDSPTFRSTVTRIVSRQPDAIFVSTQTGLAFGIFVKEFRELAPHSKIAVHTNFVAACNPDALKSAGHALEGVRYLSPAYDQKNPRFLEFLKYYKDDHGMYPAIPMHTAGTVDALDILQHFLDSVPEFTSKSFHDFLLGSVRDYHGLMGQISFDARGNTSLGFKPYQIRINNGKLLETPLLETQK